MVYDVEDSDFEIDAKIVEGIFLKLPRKQIGPDNICGRLEIVPFPAFC